MASALPQGLSTGSKQPTKAKTPSESIFKKANDLLGKGYSYVQPVTSWAVDKSAELIWFGATVSIVFGLPVLLELQREAMFQLEKDQLAEQQEAMQKQMQEAAQRGMFGFGGSGGGEGGAKEAGPKAA